MDLENVRGVLKLKSLDITATEIKGTVILFFCMSVNNIT